MPDEPRSELPGLHAAVEILERHLHDLPDTSGPVGDDATGEGGAAADVQETEVTRGALVAVKDEIFARITALGGQWPDTEVGEKQPPAES